MKQIYISACAGKIFYLCETDLYFYEKYSYLHKKDLYFYEKYLYLHEKDLYFYEKIFYSYEKAWDKACPAMAGGD